MALAEGGESEIATNDPEVNMAAPASDYSQISSTFQSELYEALMRRSNADVTDFQNLLLQLLNLLNGHQPVPRDLKIQYFTAAADRLQLMANRQPETSQTVADRYREYSHLLREMAYLQNNFFAVQRLRNEVTKQSQRGNICQAKFSCHGMLATPRNHNASCLKGQKPAIWL